MILGSLRSALGSLRSLLGLGVGTDVVVTPPPDVPVPLVYGEPSDIVRAIFQIGSVVTGELERR